MQIYKDENFELFVINGGNFWLDGGAMFGVVPKNIWGRLIPVNKENQIPMATNSLVIKDLQNNRIFLTDTGNGDKYSDKENSIYKFEDKTIVDGLKEIGISPKDVTDIIFTHLHFDHCGGSTKLNGEQIEIVFPNAQYYIQNKEWEEAINTHERNRASYLTWDFMPLMEEGKVVLVEGKTEIAGNISLIPTAGHTLGHQSILVKIGDNYFFFAGDLIPTTRHIPTPFVMSYDLYPVTTVKIKNKILQQAIDENWTLIFEHDHDTPTGNIVLNSKNKFKLRG